MREPIPKPAKVAKKRNPSYLQVHGGSRGKKWKEVRLNYLQQHEQWGGWYLCAKCQRAFQKADIDIDHIIKRSLRPDLLYDESNFQLLCRKCHVKKDGGMRVKST